MSARWIDGRAFASTRRAAVKERVATLTARGRTPTLAVVLATSDASAQAYCVAKQRTGRKLGIDVRANVVDGKATEGVVAAVRALAAAPDVDGILVEAPLPDHVDARAVFDAIPPEKDVDGASAASLGLLFAGTPLYAPATAEAIIELLAYSGIELRGRDAVVIGRSLVVGRPLAQLLSAKDATVTLCHSKTVDLAQHTRRADLLCVAMGHPRFITAAWVRPGAIVVDVGTHVVDGRVLGDVDTESAGQVAGAITPVPGGVGPATTTVLMEHVVRAAECSDK